MLSKVFLVKSNFDKLGYELESIFDIINLHKLIENKKKILIKPNLVTAAPPSSGLTTDPRIVEIVVDWLINHASIKKDFIIIGEGGMTGVTEEAFRVSGMAKMAARLGIQTVNLNKDNRVEVDIPQPLSLKTASLAETAIEADFIISIPSLKVHSMAVTTLSLKNMMGTILPKGIMHRNLDKRIADLCCVVTPDLAIIDGIVGAEKDEVHGSPVEMNITIVSTDPVAADAVGSAVMGIEP
ncbi:MAG: DUF362 domain-containing protein, partial [Candidatus Hodarchaeales archaeon]